MTRRWRTGLWPPRIHHPPALWAWFCAVALALPFIVLLIAPGPISAEGYPNLKNPLGIEALRSFVGALFLSSF